MNLILASKSPRRKEILSKLGYTFCVIPALKDEVFKGQDIDAALKNVALSKVKEVFENTIMIVLLVLIRSLFMMGKFFKNQLPKLKLLKL